MAVAVIVAVEPTVAVIVIVVVLETGSNLAVVVAITDGAVTVCVMVTSLGVIVEVIVNARPVDVAICVTVDPEAVFWVQLGVPVTVAVEVLPGAVIVVVDVLGWTSCEQAPLITSQAKSCILTGRFLMEQ